MMRVRMNLYVCAALALARVDQSFGAEPIPVREFVGRYCVACHDSDVTRGGLNLTAVLPDDTAKHPDVWEKVVNVLPKTAKNTNF